jgi:hypothetical protein
VTAGVDALEFVRSAPCIGGRCAVVVTADKEDAARFANAIDETISLIVQQANVPHAVGVRLAGLARARGAAMARAVGREW